MEFIKLYQIRFFFCISIYIFQTNRRKVNYKTKSLQLVKRTRKYHPTRLRQISFPWSAAQINAKFGRAGEMDFNVEGQWNTVKYLNSRHPRLGL